jgi:hypothetical protein
MFILFTISFFIGLFFLVSDFFDGNFIRDYLMENKTEQYLFNEGYQEKEIVSIDAKYHMKYNTQEIKGTRAHVVFKDEPEIEYQYVQLRETGEIQQTCTYFNKNSNEFERKKRKHKQTDCY